jgi:hypothetical protein
MKDAAGIENYKFCICDLKVICTEEEEEEED